MSALDTQFSVKDETVFGTPVTTDRFFEYNSESVEPVIERIQSTALRASTRVPRSDRFAVNRKGAAGTVEMDVLTKGFGWWLKHLLGAVATTGPSADGAYTHTGTVASLTGDFFTSQFNKPFNPSGAPQPWTFHGCKVPSWALRNSVDGMLVLAVTIDAEDFDTSTSLATASYPTAMENISFVGGTVGIAGSEPTGLVTDVELTVDNALKTDRYGIRGSSLKREPIEQGMRDIGLSMTMEYASLTEFNRFASATAVGALAQAVLTWEGPTLIAGATKPKLVVTLPAFRTDGGAPTVQGPEGIMVTVAGKALADPAAGAISAAYTSVDATP